MTAGERPKARATFSILCRIVRGETWHDKVARAIQRDDFQYPLSDREG